MITACTPTPTSNPPTPMDLPTDGTFTNSLGMTFKRIEPGTFDMGSHTGDWDEEPVHSVEIHNPFYIQTVEVSLEQYKQFDPSFNVENPFFSWYQATAFCEWLSQKEGLPYRLPTEAEWEYTATQQSAGVQGMIGGPLEWMHDWYGPYPQSGISIDPLGPANGFVRVLRGDGLDIDDSSHFRLTNRAGMPPSFAGETGIGLRMVLGLLPASSPTAEILPFARLGVHPAAFFPLPGPDPAIPYLIQRPYLPIPPENQAENVISAAGLPAYMMGHNHSPALEVCPNGDLLIVIYTSPDSEHEYVSQVSLLTTRLRLGSLQWDPIEMLVDFPDANDHATLLWNDNGKLYLFWGNPQLKMGGFPFQWMTSDDCGANWSEIQYPNFVGKIGPHARQPINSAFRGPDGAIYLSSDAEGASSVLWVSHDNGLNWVDPGGRSAGRHTAYALLKDGSLLAMGGKNSDIDGFMPMATSRDGGKTWQVSVSPFPAQGPNQRPSLIRLASGRLFFAADWQRTSDCAQPAGITETGALVALSENEGLTWHIKTLTGALKHETWSCPAGTLGYSVARQASNGVIHLLSTMNRAAQHFELNEAWILSDTTEQSTAIQPAVCGEPKARTSTTLSGGKINDVIVTCQDGLILLNGPVSWTFPDGSKQYEATYLYGKKIGSEILYGADGSKIWDWQHDQKNNTSIWTQYWPNGLKRVISSWEYGGMVANGPALHWDSDGKPVNSWVFSEGKLVGTGPLPEPQSK